MTVKAGANLVIPNGALIGKDGVFTATEDVTVKSANNGVQVEASAGTLTLNGKLTIDDNDSLTLKGTAKLVAKEGTVLTVGDSKVSVTSSNNNFYADATDATADSVVDGAYTFKTFTEAAGSSSITGWLKG